MDATLVDPNLVAELEERAALKSTQNFWVRRLFLCGVVAVFSVVLFFASPAVVRGALHTISPDELQSEIDGVLKQVSSLDDEREKLIAAADKASTAEENAKLNDQAKRIEARKDSYFSRLDSVQTAYQQSEGYILQLKFFMALLGLLSLTYAGYIYLIVLRTAGLQGLFEDIDEMTPLTDHLSLPPRSSAIDTIEDDVISESERNAANSRDKFD